MHVQVGGNTHFFMDSRSKQHQHQPRPLVKVNTERSIHIYLPASRPCFEIKFTHILNSPSFYLNIFQEVACRLLEEDLQAIGRKMIKQTMEDLLKSNQRNI